VLYGLVRGVRELLVISRGRGERETAQAEQGRTHALESQKYLESPSEAAVELLCYCYSITLLNFEAPYTTLCTLEAPSY
jgi:hypothetical protein